MSSLCFSGKDILICKVVVPLGMRKQYFIITTFCVEECQLFMLLVMNPFISRFNWKSLKRKICKLLLALSEFQMYINSFRIFVYKQITVYLSFSKSGKSFPRITLQKQIYVVLIDSLHYTRTCSAYLSI